MGKIKYALYENPGQKQGQSRYHVRVVKSGNMDFDKVCDTICHASSVTQSDVHGVAEAFSCLLGSELSNGESVHIKGLGYFSISVEAPGVENSRDMNAKMLKVRSVNFRPDTELMNRITKDIEFERAQIYNVSLSSAESKQNLILKEYFADHDYITSSDFQHLLCLTRTTAYRRLAALCKGPFPILKRIGAHHSSLYGLAKDADWKLG